MIISHEYINVYINNMQSNFGKVPVKIEKGRHERGSGIGKILPGKQNQERLHGEAAFSLDFQGYHR